MKRWLCLVLACLLMLSLGACAQKPKAEIALLLADKGTLFTNAFYRSAWEAIQEYCGEHKITYAYYEADNQYEEDYNKIVSQAIADGAKLLIAPGFMMEPVVYTAQDKYSAKFVTVDGAPNNGKQNEEYDEKVGPNTYALRYTEEQAGFLAGYSAVMDGFRSLGFFGGMAVPTVVRFGYGFIQGAEHAARVLDLEENAVTLKYLYCGSFSASPEIQARASVWYLQDTEVIFACGGAIDQAVMKAAEAAERWVIGVDVDQSGDSPTVIVSAVKNIRDSVFDAIEAFYGNAFPGGTIVQLGTAAEGIGLTMETARFRQFDVAAYEEIYQALATDREGLASGILLDDRAMEDIETYCVEVVMDAVR